MNLLKFLIENFEVDEALMDELPQHQRDIIAKRHGEKFLDMDVPKHTDAIPNIKVEITDETFKNKIGKLIETKFKVSITKNFRLANLFRLNVIFLNTLAKSLNINLDEVKSDPILMPIIYSKNYKLIDSKSTDVNNPIFSKNMSSLTKFIESFNRAFPENVVEYDFSKDKNLVGLQQPLKNYDINLETLKNDSLYLYITDKPEDKLNMSISKYYDSCQNIYTGSIKSRLLSNVFDKNSKVAYLIFDEPFKDSMGNTVPFTSITRMIIRHVKGEIFFDKTYPEDINFDDIVTKYAGIKSTYGGEDYDYDPVDDLMSPYMDNLKIDKEKLVDEKRKLMAKLLNIEYKKIEKTDNPTIFTYNNNFYYVLDKLHLDELKYSLYYNNIYKFIDNLPENQKNKLYYDTYLNYIDTNEKEFNKTNLIKLIVQNHSNNFYETLKDVNGRIDKVIINFVENNMVKNSASTKYSEIISSLIELKPINEKLDRLFKLINEDINTKTGLNPSKINYLFTNFIFQDENLINAFFDIFSTKSLFMLLFNNNSDVYKSYVKKGYLSIPKEERNDYTPEDTAVELAEELANNDVDSKIIGEKIASDEEYTIFLDNRR